MTGAATVDGMVEEPGAPDWSNLRRGDRWLDPSNADPEWRPAPGQKYADAPTSINQVTMRRGNLVWYGCVSRSTGELLPGRSRDTVDYLQGRYEGRIP